MFARKPITKEERIARGWERCDYCRGHGSYYNGWVRLGCHRCINGLTTVDRARSASDWEMHYAFCYGYGKTRTPEERAEGDEIIERYREARKHDFDIDYFRPLSSEPLLVRIVAGIKARRRQEA